MFNSGIKGNQRCNGLVPPTRTVNYNKLVKSLGTKDTYNNDKKLEPTFRNMGFPHSDLDTKVKIEFDEEEIEAKVISPSIIGLSDDKTHKSPPVKPRLKSGSRATHHETLQRIDDIRDFYNHYQHHWFSPSLEKFKLEDRSREERIEITRHEFLRHLQQIVRSNVGKPHEPHSGPAAPPKVHRHPHQAGYDRLVAPLICQVENCFHAALPCTRHCTLHIMLNSEQVLFGYCTAKFADNTQCSVPVFDITHELPLCPEHARKRDNYKLYQEAKPKKLRKKVKPSAMIRPQKRNKKKKKPNKTPETTTPSAIINIPGDVGEIVHAASPELEEDMHMVDQVLGLNESDALEQVLETQASHLLEETDISTVLSTIQVDEFSDFFAVNRNGEYEPSREEAEELEKALAAVDNDVKSLEKLSQSQGLLDSLLDEHTLAESLVQIPDVFHNGYAPCGDSMVAQTSSFLLPVEPQSHS
ncbi:INO80 complex subunit D-B isoform X1 [Tribolium castaneum]|uniref:INO80 complex subunit D-B isoform X1 n=1 Tax=Tribolium castaneum TaxID=7070 RepID=UPI00077DB251|nr:PREDICTED: INO80 complex subunit D-B [Tribolium castaneum]XP_015836963.1 PREDICTED: INO80 complex subunit D-B [Tribolium castaneum]XP_015836964.1 PREDICTED: INO80 complex subunit D-B [Tribolium castaneum]XP_015836965.1 PREDICTED: INO80 complex subunit D-B [Tribolium castaneum]|eukprot:XP_015836962.1 PREDICTED: INO80 complex subunit D-B [Tribolium castaneum]